MTLYHVSFGLQEIEKAFIPKVLNRALQFWEKMQKHHVSAFLQV